MTKQSNFVGLLPLIFFIVIYVLTGIYADNFSSMPLLVAFTLAVVVALVIQPKGQKTTFEEKMTIFTKAAGDSDIIMMVLIFLLAGAFYSVTDQMGAVSSIVNLGLSVIPSNMVLVGIFIIGCVLSFAMGTSMGAITALAPIGVGVAEQVGGNPALIMATVVGGAMFGDNCSFVSDTTIAACRTQGVTLKEKFKYNIITVLPAIIGTIVLLAILPFGNGAETAVGDYSLINIIPYVLIIVAALAGIHVMSVLALGVMAGIVIGFMNGSLDYLSALESVQRGMGWMQNLGIIAIVVSGLVGLMKHYGGIDYLLDKITERSSGTFGGQMGIAALVSLITLATTNNTIGILTAGTIAKDISEKYGIDKVQTASLLDVCGCSMNGLMPYAGQLLMVAGLAKISPISVMPYAFYPMMMFVMAMVSIVYFSKKSVSFTEKQA
ncbi:Na+/H+ antiporter NhaC family protein [Vibrio sinensis]|uniref:Na+/H+ antiporter NhaC family protein n=1 Tax=Vibrio sinensis TaxID=2302434 RepID=A0A3A6QS37_9VIBR|nr:Na+/H+ antiporter NhaC family protein [Vibrio sinensis]RJX75203.1 Na+/H+ antiporter NhaC family protein [Vibrio sinensis]